MLSDLSVKFWRCRERTLTLGAPLVMGILNVTPDSFYTQSRVDATEVLARAERFWQAGAQILDIGGESTRPGAATISAEIECDRVLPVVQALRKTIPEAFISVDTRHTLVAKTALEVGADIINDVSGCAPDQGMAQTIADFKAGYILTHAFGTADEGRLLDDPETCTTTVRDELLTAAHRFEEAGVDPTQIMLDPGLGFAKTNAVSLRLLQSTATFAALPYPLMIAASRKRFLGEITHQSAPEMRGAASLGAALAAVILGANALRVHDVRETIDALQLFSLITQREDFTHV